MQQQLFNKIKSTIDQIALEKRFEIKYHLFKALKDDLVIYRTKFELFDAMEKDAEDCGKASKLLISAAKALLNTDWTKIGIGNAEALELAGSYIEFSRKFAFLSIPVENAYRVFRPEIIDRWAEEGWL